MNISDLAGSLPAVHPGEFLREDFLSDKGISAKKLAKKIDVPEEVIKDLVAEKGEVTEELAEKFADFFGNTKQFWLGLQQDFNQSNK